MKTIDYQALTEPFTPEQQKKARDNFAPKQKFFSRKMPWVYIIIFVPIVMLNIIISGSDLAFAAVFIPGLIIIPIVIFQMRNAMQKSIERKARLANFAEQNKFTVKFDAQHETFPGLIFAAGHSKHLREQLQLDDKVAIGNYQFVTGNGKNSQTHTFGYIEIALPRKLPHMLLDAKANNFFGISTLPTTFNASQRMQLEGDFNNYFDLYVPKEYERDALYVFTPDIMALSLDHAVKYDIEVVDNKLYLYQTKFIDMLQPKELAQIFEAVAVISNKFERRVDYYADDRVVSRQDNVVASQGERLKKGVPWRIIILVGGFIVFYMIATIAPYVLTILTSR